MSDKSTIAIAAVVLVGGGIVMYGILTDKSQKQKSTIVTTPTPTPSPSPTPSTHNGVATGNWLVGSEINWYGPNYYIMPNGQSVYFSTYVSLLSYAQQNGYLNISYQSTPISGSYSNPYNYSQGYQGSGWYVLSSSDFTKLSKIPASGITTNPFYTDNQTFYNNIGSWLYQVSPTTYSSPTSSSTPTITITPTSISLTQNATITISGSGFVPNSSGYVSGSNIEITGFKADGNGNFNIVAMYQPNSISSGLANAIKNVSGNSLDIVAFDYANGSSSNIVTLYFA